MANRALAWIGSMLAGFSGICVAGAQTQPPASAPAPELDLLEYLGSWQGDDDEWLAVAGWQGGQKDSGRGNDERTPPRAPPEESDDDADSD